MIEALSVVPKELWALLISMVPIIELRGGIPIAEGLGIPELEAFIICCIGNILPVPFIIVYMKPIFNFLKKSKLLRGLVEKVENRAKQKAEKTKQDSEKKGHSEKRKRFLVSLALFMFVAIPLPGTGAWTGSMIAAMLDMRLKRAFPAVALGVITAGIIMMIATQVGFGLFAI